MLSTLRHLLYNHFMNSPVVHNEIRTVTYPGGDLQRVQIVRAADFRSLDFYRPSFSRQALESLYEVYRDEIIPLAPALFGEVFIFHIPSDMFVPFDDYGMSDRHAAARRYLTENFPDAPSRAFLEQLRHSGYLYQLKGKNPLRKSFVAYGDDIGFLSKDNDSALRVNASFFTFDLMDAASCYDIFGTPIGLMVKDGRILNPPLFGREALLVDNNGEVTVTTVSLDQLTLNIKGTIYQRPNQNKTPESDNDDLVIIGNRIVAVNPGGRSVIPSSGFIINTPEKHSPGEEVIYGGLEDIVFGLQVGNSVVVNGIKTEKFISPFYNIRKLHKITYPPALFPLDFNRDRAPRIVLGADDENRPVLLWLEGAPKTGYRKGTDSCGATMKETADIAFDLGLRNAITLDGGGSAQILINGCRQLAVSGRYCDGRQKERAVPVGLKID